MTRALEDGAFPGAVLGVRLRGQIVYERAFGQVSILAPSVPTALNTIYDLASLTKPLATTGGILCLIQDGRLALETRVSALLPELEYAPVGGVTVFQLLNHSSGLPAWRPFYQWIAAREGEQPGLLGSEAARERVLGYLAQETLEVAAGVRARYSDLGFMLLGFIVERISGQPFADFCESRIFGPAQAKPLGFLRNETEAVKGEPEGQLDPKLIAPTEDDPWRARVLRGEVHDENAYAMGGVAGHAGLFGTAAAVLAVSRLWLEGSVGRAAVFEPELVQRFVTMQDSTPGSSWALGWDTPSVPSSAGARFSPLSFGHLGFTGTSLWIDPTRELEVVLLSNRVHPSRKNNRIQEVRPAMHDLIWEEFLGT